jgi:phosphoenolpyruvate carboxykinase (GTP)
VLVGASVASETTAAATGKVGVTRRDPMAMKPFCGYNFADYWQHWLSFDGRSQRLPRIFHVNWFRQDGDGRFLWPGFGENLRVLRWIIDRCAGRVAARNTPIGLLPRQEDINLDGLAMPAGVMDALLGVDASSWRHEMTDIGQFFEAFGPRVPRPLIEEHQRVTAALR